MMQKEKSSPWARLKYLYVLPVAAVAVTAFARPEVSRVTEEISSAKVNDLAAIVETKVTESVEDTIKSAEVKVVGWGVQKKLEGTPVFDVAEQMPEFPDGGIPGLMDYFKKNMRYPEAAKEKGMQGRVTVQFVVDKDGSIKNARILRPVNEEFDAEALRLINSMPKWKPGMQKGEPVAVKYTVPVMFRLDGDAGNADSGNPDPLVIVDGKEVTPSIMSALDPSKIENVTVLKEEASVAPYGDKGKNGVILITLAKDASFTMGTPEEQSKIRVVGEQTVSKEKTGLPGIGGIYTGGKKVDSSELDIYVDGVKVNKSLNEINAEQIECIEVKKSDDGNGSIYVTTKQAAGKAGKEAIKVEGKVVDVKGEPIIGASILIEGTHIGTVTDMDGSFRLPVPSKDAVLVVSYIGMETAKVKAQPKLTVTLKDE